MLAIIKVRLYRSPFSVCCVCKNYFTAPEERIYKALNVKNGNRWDFQINEVIKGKRWMQLTTSALFLQPFAWLCANSRIFRSNLLAFLSECSGKPANGTVFLKLILEPPDREIIDYSWNERISKLVWTRVELENAFSWLSTLGGAYSALGDYFDYCAEEAGRISIRQYQLSKLLGDDSLVARSCLYSALSYSQKGNLRLSRRIVRIVAKFARKAHDKRLMRMCQGVWAKIKYLRAIKNQSQGTTVWGNGDRKVIVIK